MPSLNVSIVIPAYNEARRIRATLERVSAYLETHADTEVIFIDDGSTDGTGEIIKSFFKNSHSPIIVERLPINRGKGAAIATGVFLAHGDFIAFVDADLATDISCVAQCMELAIHEHADVVCTSRYVTDSHVVQSQPLFRRLLGRAFRLMTHALFPTLPVHDTQNGCKLFTASAARSIFADLQTSRWAFDLEILLRAADQHLVVKELPIVWHHREGGHLTVRQMSKMLYELLALWFYRHKKIWFVWPSVLSLLLHSLFLNLPQQAVFDEVYFSTFASSYFTGSYYFDIHPPLGKMLLAGCAWLFGYRGGAHFTAIGTNPGIPWIQFLGFRLLPMLAGITIPLIIALCVAQYTKSRKWGLVAGFLTALESGLLVQTRYSFLDGLLVLFGFSALLVYERYREALRTPSHQASPSGGVLYAATMVLAGLAIDIKWTALTFLGLIAIREAIHLFEKPFVLLRRAFLGVLILGTIYVLPFIVHLSLLKAPGPGDVFMPAHFQQHTIWKNIIDLNVEMYHANQTITATHSYGSKWYTWPFMARPVFYWSNNDSVNIGRIYYFGNPLIYFFALFSVCLLALGLVFNVIKPERRTISARVVCAYLANLLPFLLIHRVMFLYHYLTALLFGIMAIAIAGESLLPQPDQSRIARALVIAAAICFLFFTPLIYGFPEPEWLLRLHQWLPTWD